MMSASRTRRATAAGCLLVLAALATACGAAGEIPPSKEGDIPPELSGPATPVDVCSLLSPALAGSTLGLPLRVVGVEYGAARVPTFRCLLGDEFGVALVRTELATGPISENVFTAAYGETAGGDPELVQRFGLKDTDLGPGRVFGFLRNEKDELSLHVYLAGSIISLEVKVDPARPVKKSEVISLAATILTRLPENPQLAATDPGNACGRVPDEVVGAAIGADPRVAAHQADPGGSVMCSWASSPGSATVTVIRSPAEVAAYRRSLDDNLYSPVEFPGKVEVLSRDDHAGDLTIFDGRGAMAFISVVPSAGFSDGTILTTPGELDLAASVVDGVLAG